MSMEMVEDGDHVAGFIVLRDNEGALHAVRAPSVNGIHQAGVGSDQTLLSLPGGRVLMLDSDFPSTLAKFANLPFSRRG